MCRESLVHWIIVRLVIHECNKKMLCDAIHIVLHFLFDNIYFTAAVSRCGGSKYA